MTKLAAAVLQGIGYRTPIEHENAYYRQNQPAPQTLPGEPQPLLNPGGSLALCS